VNVVAALAGSLGLLSLVLATWILAQLSKRLGEVTKMPPYYRGFYVSMACLSVAVMVHFLRMSVFLAEGLGPPMLHSDVFYLGTYYIPLAVGMTLDLAIAWRYWSWLLRE
jgi:hypothetical protein